MLTRYAKGLQRICRNSKYDFPAFKIALGLAVSMTWGHGCANQTYAETVHLPCHQRQGVRAWSLKSSPDLTR